ncbi:MAG: hypothetical protein NC543_09485, partial [bacterium]|nr:hypothetical protein [bacterium]
IDELNAEIEALKKVSRDKPQPQQTTPQPSGGNTNNQTQQPSGGGQQTQQPPADTDSDDVTGGALSGLPEFGAGGIGSGGGDLGINWE